MATVILGGGIIGLSIAHCLSLERPPSAPGNPHIHILDSSHSLLLSASGFAGGFLAEDWMSPASASLAALSFRLHRELALQHEGQRRWGYAGSQVYSLSIDGTGVVNRKRGQSQDWISSGTSRANAAPDLPPSTSSSGDPPNSTGSQVETFNPDGSPACFTAQPGGTLSTIGMPSDCAQIHPRSLCSFLLAQCQSRGVQLHLSATPTSIVTDNDSSTLTGLHYTSPTTEGTTSLDCSNLVLAAGPWTPSLFATLFPHASTRIPIYPLAGHSVLAKSPRYVAPFPLSRNEGPPSSKNKSGEQQQQHICYAVYCSPTPASFIGHAWTYAPEAFARLSPDGQTEIWVGGLNEPDLALPPRAEDVKPLLAKGKGYEAAKREMRGCAVQLCGRAMGDGGQQGDVGGRNEDDLRDVSEGLCFRPVSETGVPVVGRVGNEMLGGVKTAGEKGKGMGGVFVASGHGPWGISLSLGTGKVVSEMVLGETLSADVSRLALG